MNKGIVCMIMLFVFGWHVSNLGAQITSASDNLVAHPVPDRTVMFEVSGIGLHKPITWGLDLAWLSRDNIKRGIAFMGSERVDIVRSSFTPTAALEDGELPTYELGRLNERLDIIDLFERNMNLVLNCDHPSVDAWYQGNASNWAQLIDVTAAHCEERGHTIVTISPFNEPDYTATGQGSIDDFYNVAGALKQNPRFENVRISGGNTLNTDEALVWYTPLKDRLDEGNTHQLAGTFDNYAGFFETVRADGNHATNDELHNVMEAMVGSEYGMQTGIWWGTAEYARGEFVKASDGERLAYAEHRDNWTAASVYRGLEGNVQAFAGASERQALTTTYRYVSKDRDVYYDGHGPQREFLLEVPGGSGYQIDQPNAERVLNITWGDDIQPVIDGEYILVNRNSGKVMEVIGGSNTAGANIRQRSYLDADYQHWNVVPVSSRIGGDFSYFSITALHNGMSPDIYNWSLDDGGNIVQWDATEATNQQWYLEYAGDGWFYIRSRHSAKCIEVAGSSMLEGGNIEQGEKDGGANQQWRFVPAGAQVEFDAPAAPSGLLATQNTGSVLLEWIANTEEDVAGYTVLRSTSEGGPYNTIARNVSTTSFVDNTVLEGVDYYYTIRAVDKSLNRSAYSNEIYALATGDDVQIARLAFEGDVSDSSVNLNNGASYGTIEYVEGKVGSEAVLLDGSNNFIQLPSTIANHKDISIATWVKWNGGARWAPIFAFENDKDESISLTPFMKLLVKNDGEEHVLSSSRLTSGVWSHVVATLSDTGVKLYVDGELVDALSNVSLSTLDFKPVLNYIGRSQQTTALFNGCVDDFRIYNYELSVEEINVLAGNSTDVFNNKADSKKDVVVTPMPANDMLTINVKTGNFNGTSVIKLYDNCGSLILATTVESMDNVNIHTSGLPSGYYILQVNHDDTLITKKVVVRH